MLVRVLSKVISACGRRREGGLCPSPDRRGAILVLSTILLVVVAGMVAFSVDLGYMYTVRTELKRATDAAALAGAGALPEGTDVAYYRAVDFLLRNPVANRFVPGEENRLEQLESWLAAHPEAVQFEVGHWNPVTREFVPSLDHPSAVRFVANFQGAPLFFGRIFGRDQFSVQAESIARFQPRDIVLVLDFSASMNDDSELRRISEFGESWRPTIEAGLYQIWQELGSPQFGNLPWQPDYVTLVGKAPQEGCEPQIYVKFLEYERQVWVQSTKDLSNVVVQYSDGSTQRYDNLRGRTGTFGSGTKTIARVWVKSGCNESGDGPGYGEKFEASWTNDNTRIKRWFGLDRLPYPFPAGSWDEYIDYVKTSSFIHGARYRKKYGLLTLVNYWLEQRPQSNETPVLWQTSAQPVHSLKEAVHEFINHLKRVRADDWLGLAIYNSPDGTALIEQRLSRDLDIVGTITAARQAGHYDRYTNIGAGLQKGWQELDARGRPNTKKVIVLMTDGWANRPTDNPREFALEQARIAASKGYQVLTVSFGVEADTQLMEEIAQITGGRHFRVPGGTSVEQYRQELISVFRQIADDRPLVLVK